MSLGLSAVFKCGIIILSPLAVDGYVCLPVRLDGTQDGWHHFSRRKTRCARICSIVADGWRGGNYDSLALSGRECFACPFDVLVQGFPSMPARLVALDGGPDILIDQDMVVVGRHPSCDARLDSLRLSRHHCCLTQEHGEIVVRDLGTSTARQLHPDQRRAGKSRATAAGRRAGDRPLSLSRRSRHRSAIACSAASSGRGPVFPTPVEFHFIGQKLMGEIDSAGPEAVCHQFRRAGNRAARRGAAARSRHLDAQPGVAGDHALSKLGAC